MLIPQKFRNQSIRKPSTLLLLLVSILIFSSLGTWLLISSHAATPTVSLEPEASSLSGVSTIADSSASGGKAIQFGAATSGFADPLCNWMGVANKQYPCAADTGYPSGTTLHTSGCPNTLSTAGATYTGCHWTDTVSITAANITITNSLITGGGQEAVECTGNCANALISHTTIDYANYLPTGSPTPTTPSTCNGGEAVHGFGGNLVLDHIHVVGWSDGIRWGGNTTTQNSYMEGCGITTGGRADHADIMQGYLGDANDVARHNTLQSGLNYAEDAADITFSADTSVGQTYDNNYLIIGSHAANSNQNGFDIRGDDMTGTITVTNNVFDMPGSGHHPVNCTNGPVTWIFSGNRLIDGTSYSKPC